MTIIGHGIGLMKDKFLFPLNSFQRLQSLEKSRIPSAQIQFYRHIDRQNILLGADSWR
jgi:hypothetical protein